MHETDIFAMIGGSFIGLLFGAIAYFVKGYFDDRKEKALSNEKEIKEVKDRNELIQENIVAIRTDLLKRDNKNSTEFLKLSMKIDSVAQTVQQYQSEISKLDGRINEHFHLVSAHISTIGHMSRQIDALFKIIESHTGPRRFSDGGGT